MKNNKLPLLSLKKAFGNQAYQVMDEAYKKSLLQNPLLSGLFTAGRSFVIVANTFNWRLEMLTGDSLNLTGYSNEEIMEMQGDFVVNFSAPGHSDFNFAAVKAFMEYSNSCPFPQREMIFAVYYYAAIQRHGEQIIVQHQSIPLVFDDNCIPYVFCNIYSDITYLEPRSIPQAMMVNKATSEIFHLNPDNYSLEKRIELFSPREKEIIRYLAMGYTSRQIALILHISNDTVRTHRKNILAKAGIKNTASLIRYALVNGIY